jgi:hypothetical protein
MEAVRARELNLASALGDFIITECAVHKYVAIHLVRCKKYQPQYFNFLIHDEGIHDRPSAPPRPQLFFPLFTLLFTTFCTGLARTLALLVPMTLVIIDVVLILKKLNEFLWCKCHNLIGIFHPISRIILVNVRRGTKKLNLAIVLIITQVQDVCSQGYLACSQLWQ